MQVDMEKVYKPFINDIKSSIFDVNIKDCEILNIIIKVIYEILEEVSIFKDKEYIDYIDTKSMNISEFVKVRFLSRCNCDNEEISCNLNDCKQLQEIINIYCKSYNIDIIDITIDNKYSLLEYTYTIGNDIYIDFEKLKNDYNYLLDKKIIVSYKITPMLWQIEQSDILRIRNCLYYGCRYYIYSKLSDLQNEQTNISNKKMYINEIEKLKNRYNIGYEFRSIKNIKSFI